MCSSASGWNIFLNIFQLNKPKRCQCSPAFNFFSKYAAILFPLRNMTWEGKWNAEETLGYYSSSVITFFIWVWIIKQSFIQFMVHSECCCCGHSYWFMRAKPLDPKSQRGFFSLFLKVLASYFGILTGFVLPFCLNRILKNMFMKDLWLEKSPQLWDNPLLRGTHCWSAEHP